MTDSNVDAHHEELHRSIFLASRLADWIYHDIRLDCDGEAVDRTVERLTLIEKQHGTATLFGLVGAWAYKASYRVQKALARAGMGSDSLVPYVSEQLDTSSLTTEQRGSLSAFQFFKAVSSDDLEMAEAIFNAAASATEEDLSAFVLAVLATSVILSDQAEGIGRDR